METLSVLLKSMEVDDVDKNWVTKKSLNITPCVNEDEKLAGACCLDSWNEELFLFWLFVRLQNSCGLKWVRRLIFQEQMHRQQKITDFHVVSMLIPVRIWSQTASRSVCCLQLDKKLEKQNWILMISFPQTEFINVKNIFNFNNNSYGWLNIGSQ